MVLRIGNPCRRQTDRPKSLTLATSRRTRTSTRAASNSVPEQIIDEMIDNTVGGLNRLALQPTASTSNVSNEIVQPNEHREHLVIPQPAMNQQTDLLASQQVSSIALQQQQQAELPASQQASNVALQQQQVVLPPSHQAMVPLAQTSHQQHVGATTSEQAIAQQAMASNQHTLQLNSAGQSQQSSVLVQTGQSIVPPIVTQQPFAPMAQLQANVAVHQGTQSAIYSIAATSGNCNSRGRNKRGHHESIAAARSSRL